MRDASACLMQKVFHIETNDALALAGAYSSWWQQWQQQHQKKQDIYLDIHAVFDLLSCWCCLTAAAEPPAGIEGVPHAPGLHWMRSPGPPAMLHPYMQCANRVERFVTDGESLLQKQWESKVGQNKKLILAGLSFATDSNMADDRV